MNQALRAVLVGCGGISQAWLKPACSLDGLEIVGLVDIVAENARRRAEQFDLKDVETGVSLTEVLNHTTPDIVFNCTVPEAHMDVVLEALDSGCHVLSEKPLADSMENARRMVAKAGQVGRLFAVMQNRRFMPDIRAVQSALAGGLLGPLTTIHCDFFLGPHFGGFREQMAHVLLLDMAIHTFDQARFLSGANPLSVYCKEWNPAGSWYSRDASATAVFEMTGGLVYTYRGSWCAEGNPTTWESDWRIIGQNGSLTWDGGKGMSAETARWKGEFFAETTSQVIEPYTGPKVDGHAGLIRDFVDCVRTGKIPETSAADNIFSLAMVFGAIESADTHRLVNLAL